jgi:thiol-disulfide isomerase/thioredoxin
MKQRSFNLNFRQTITKFIILTTVGSLLLGCSPTRPANYVPPSVAPLSRSTIKQLSLPDLNTGAKRSVTGAPDKPTLVLFWASWCPACRQELPRISPVIEQLAKEGLIRVIYISADRSREEAQAFTQYADLKSPSLLDSYRLAQEAFQVSALPSARVISNRGKIYVVNGRLSWLERDEILKLLGVANQ